MKTNSQKGKDKPVKKNLKKGAATRERILAAALKVFSRHSYNAGSIRMIGKEGGFDHGIIRYHFVNKAELFEALLENATETFYNQNKSWLEDTVDNPPEEGFPRYLDRMLTWCFAHPEYIRLFTKNLSQADDRHTIPGYRYIPGLLSRCRELGMSMIALRASSEAFERFTDTFNIQMFNFVGAASAQAAMLNVDPDSKKYREWVKETMTYIFLPHFIKLIYPDRKVEI